MSKGFHLIELLITLVIISILAAISMPIYSQYLAHAKQLEAAGMLSKLALAMEKYFLEHHTYQDATLAGLNFSELKTKNTYQFVIQRATEHDYVLAAIPQGKQAAQDNICGTLTLDSNGFTSAIPCVSMGSR